MEEAVYLLGGLRSPIGLTGGVFQAIRPEELGAALFRAIFAKLPEARKADEVMGGQCRWEWGKPHASYGPYGRT